jgi:hypothetical protein
MLQIIQKSHFSYLEVGKTTSRDFLAKIEKSKFCFFEKNFNLFFNNACASAWNFFCFLICKVKVVSFY